MNKHSTKNHDSPQPSYQTSKVPLVIQEFNSDEKVEEVNRLINILSARKKLSIIVSMLMFFQDKNYPKILKDYLIEGVKDYIENNPGRVISYNGEPFTRDNCFMGMRVVIGKHRVFLKEMIDGAEYLHVNLSTTANFLSDEISKICKGPRNNRPIHCALVDDPKYEFKSSNLIGDKLDLANNTFEQDDNLKSEDKIDIDKNLGVNPCPNQDSFFSEMTSNNLDMRDDDEFSEAQEEKILNRNFNEKGNIINLAESDEGEQENHKKNNDINNDNYQYGKNVDNDIGMVDKNILETNNCDEAPKCLASNITNIFSKEFRDIDVKLLQNKSRRNNKNKKKIPINLEINKSKYSFQEIMSIKNFGKASPINAYLKENKEDILKYIELFKLFQTLGNEGVKQFERLEKLNPTINQEDSRSQMDNSENKNTNMEEVFNEFEIKKDNLIRIYKRIQSTVSSIYTFSNSNQKFDNLMKDDVNYLKLNSKEFNNLLEEMFPLFDLIHSQTQHFAIANITKNLRKISDSLKENDVGFKNFFVFVQSLINRIPIGAIRGNNLCDILGDENEEIEERKKHFCEILNKEKIDLINNIEPVLKQFNNNEDYK